MIIKDLFPEDMGALVSPTSSSELLSALKLSQIYKILYKKKFLLFRGFNSDDNDFVNFSELVGKEFLTYQAGAYERQKIKGKNNLLSVTGFSQKNGVPLHGEMYYKKNKPDLLWFYCDTAPLKGGATTVCDAQAFYENLSKKTKNMLNAMQITYIREYTPEKWKGIFQVETPEEVLEIAKKENLEVIIKPMGRIETHYTCNAIQKSEEGAYYFINNILPVAIQGILRRGNVKLRLANGKRLPFKVLFELIQIARKKSLQIQWQKGDIALLDNKKLMHGRTRIRDNQRNIFVRMSQSRREVN